MENNFKFQFVGEYIKIHRSWACIFTELKSELKDISEELKKCKFTPSLEKVFRVFEMPLYEIKVIILGQDPYPQKDIATGLAFECDLTSWNDKEVNSSLKNIIKKLYKDQKKLSDIPSFPDTKAAINKGLFEIRPPNELFKSLTKSGIFLLNTSLTCEIDKSDSHRKLWLGFTEKIIMEISSCEKSKYWLLWGKRAEKYNSIIDKTYNKITIAPHPVNNRFLNADSLGVLKYYL